MYSRLANALFALFAIGLLQTAVRHRVFLVWNTSHSVPIGLYRISNEPVFRGQLVAIILPPVTAAIADERAYLAKRALLLKSVIAIAGDRVCRHAAVVTLNGHLAAIARPTDSNGRALPRWRGCRRLGDDEIFVLSRSPGSFDGRYFGPLQLGSVIGIAHPVWTSKH